MPVEWRSGSNMAFVSVGVPMEWRTGLAVSATVPIETSNKAQSVTATVPLAFGLSVAAKAAVPIATIANYLTSILAPIEWARGLSVGFVANAALPLEWSLSAGIIVLVPIEGVAGQASWGAALEPDAWERAHEPVEPPPWPD
jgi:hypothetical protein